ncbi:tetratricopeptide repeat protein [Phaeospirillum tilakii]|uniref:Tetratricopeptide repeat protein n=1 Tax=Phaeospirillum tilakii TaxID=741673 RepID=A0ABW5CDC2_9PROT
MADLGDRTADDVDAPDPEIEQARALVHQGRNAEAIESLLATVKARPGFAGAYSMLGSILRFEGEIDAAIAAHRQAIACDPARAEAYSCLGAALCDRGELDAAIEAHRQAIALGANGAGAYAPLAAALLAKGEIEPAREMTAAALARNPTDAPAHFTLARLRLLDGDLRRGWEEYEWRTRPGVMWRTVRAFPCPPWQGEDPLGRTLLLHAEQGLGDTIQFVRFAARLEAAGARLVLEVQPPLAGLIARSFPCAQVLRKGEPLPPVDFHCPLGSLPHRFDIGLDQLPGPVPYLVPDPAAVAEWRRRLGGLGGLKIGIAWAGNPAYQADHARSFAPGRVAALIAALSRPGITLFALQKDPRPEDRAALAAAAGQVLDLSAVVGDFDHTGAIATALDLIVSTDTSLPHLTGALGLPTWLLLPRVPDWRWLLDRPDTPWYPSLRLFRQQQAGDWDGVLAALAAAL